MQSSNTQQQLRQEVKQRLNDKRYWVRKVNGAYIVQLRADDPKKPMKTEPTKMIQPKNDTYMDKYNSNLLEIDLSCYIKLQKLLLVKNKLKNIDLSNLPELVELNIDQNQIKQLDVSRNRKLYLLRANHNQLRQLDLSNNPMIYSLYLYQNYLEKLVLWFHPHFDSNMGTLFISNQKAKKCEVVFFCRANKSSQSNMFRTALENHFGSKEGGKSQLYQSKYNCGYVFRSLEKN